MVQSWMAMDVEQCEVDKKDAVMKPTPMEAIVAATSADGQKHSLATSHRQPQGPKQ